MNPLVIAGVLAAAIGGFLLLRKKGPAVDRGVAMARLADILYRIIGRTGFTPSEPQEAVTLAGLLGMPKTQLGITSSKGLPNDERWPGSELSVASYIYEYTKGRNGGVVPVAVAAGYNDETPLPGFEDPRQVRALAVGLDKQGKALEAKVYHIKADALNKIIRAAKTRNSVVSTAKGGVFALKSLGGLFKGK